MPIWEGRKARMELMRNVQNYYTSFAEPERKTPIEGTGSRREGILQGKLCK
jgi:hypothetical protein